MNPTRPLLDALQGPNRASKLSPPQNISELPAFDAGYYAGTWSRSAMENPYACDTIDFREWSRGWSAGCKAANDADDLAEADKQADERYVRDRRGEGFQRTVL